MTVSSFTVSSNWTRGYSRCWVNAADLYLLIFWGIQAFCNDFFNHFSLTIFLLQNLLTGNSTHVVTMNCLKNTAFLGISPHIQYICNLTISSWDMVNMTFFPNVKVFFKINYTSSGNILLAMSIFIKGGGPCLRYKCATSMLPAMCILWTQSWLWNESNTMWSL